MQKGFSYTHEEIQDMVFQDDIVKAHNYRDSLKRPRTEVIGERKLLLALLEGAFSDYYNLHLGGKGKGEVFHFAAKLWIAGDDKPFNFDEVCTYLGIDPNYIRRAMGVRDSRPFRRIYSVGWQRNQVLKRILGRGELF